MTRRLSAWGLLALLSLLLVLAACKREPADSARAPGDPVAAVKGLAQALRDNDLVRWSRLSLPPDLQKESEALWKRRQAQAEPPTAEDVAEYAEMMARLTAPDAEQALMRDLEPKLKKFEGEVAGQWPLMNAAAGMFIKAAIQANTELAAPEKAHANEVVDSLLGWAQPELFTDRERARKAIAVLADTARKLDLPTLEQARALPMLPALEKGGIALAGSKDVARIYGIDLDAALDGVQARLVSTDGDQAVVAVTYPLLDRTLTFEMALLRRDGGWYSAEAIRQVEQDLADSAAGPAVVAGDAGDAETGDAGAATRAD
jgi:hypothetical protein